MKTLIYIILSMILAASSYEYDIQPENSVYESKQKNIETVIEVADEQKLLQAEAIIELEDPIQAEIIIETSNEDTIDEGIIEKDNMLENNKNNNKSIKKEDISVDLEDEEDESVNSNSDEIIIDNSVIESCNHTYTRIHGTGGEEGDVWEYSCDKCGDLYFEPYDDQEEYVELENEEEYVELENENEDENLDESSAH